jgi:hypothetical protein
MIASYVSYKRYFLLPAAVAVANLNLDLSPAG